MKEAEDIAHAMRNMELALMVKSGRYSGWLAIDAAFAREGNHDLRALIDREHMRQYLDHTCRVIRQTKDRS